MTFDEGQRNGGAGMVMEPLPHKGFVWHELMTSDVDA